MCEIFAFRDARVECADDFRVVIGNVLAHQLLRSRLGELLIDGSGGDMEGAEPATERDEVGEVGIAQGDQFAFHILLCGGEFDFQLIWFIIFRAFQQRSDMARDAFSGAESLAVARELLGERFDLRQVIGLHDEEAIGNEKSDLDGEVGAIKGHALGDFSFHGMDGEGREKLQRFKDLSDRWSGKIIHGHFLAGVFVIEQVFRHFRCGSSFLGGIGSGRLGGFIGGLHVGSEQEQGQQRDEVQFHAVRMADSAIQ